MTLTALDFLGFGLPPGSPSLGELLSQGKANVQAPWLGFTGFFAVAIMLSLLIFIGEARARRLRSAQDVPVGIDAWTPSTSPCSTSATSRWRFTSRAARRSRSTRSRSRSSAARCVALVGESGSGKSVSALSILKLLPYPTASHPSGSIHFKGRELLDAAGERDSQHSRQRHLDHLPGADDLAQSAAHDRVADRRDPAAARRHARRDGAGAHAGTARLRSAFPSRRRGWRAIRINCPAASASA